MGKGGREREREGRQRTRGFYPNFASFYLKKRINQTCSAGKPQLTVILESNTQEWLWQHPVGRRWSWCSLPHVLVLSSEQPGSRENSKQLLRPPKLEAGPNKTQLQTSGIAPSPIFHLQSTPSKGYFSGMQFLVGPVCLSGYALSPHYSSSG